MNSNATVDRQETSKDSEKVRRRTNEIKSRKFSSKRKNERYGREVSETAYHLRSRRC